MNANPIDPSAMVDSLVPKGGPPDSNAEGSSLLLRAPYPPKRVTNLVGKVFGRLKIAAFYGVSPRKDRGSYWEAHCLCGNRTIVSRHNLMSGNTLSCGCYQREIAGKYRQVSLVGRTFGRLTVLSPAPKRANNWSTFWRCRCTCGKTSTVNGQKLLSNHTKSCGCLAAEMLKARIGAKNPAWNPGLTEKDRGRKRLGTAEHTRMFSVARKIRARDRATCIICGAYPGTQVHHIEPWALNRSLRYTAANLVTLCKCCHREFHKLHGWEGGYYEFISFMKGANDGD